MQNLGFESKTPYDKASIVGFRSPRSENRGKRNSQQNPSRKRQSHAKACEAHAAPSLAEYFAIGNRQRCNESIHKGHHNLQAVALQCPLDSFLNRYMDAT